MTQRLHLVLTTDNNAAHPEDERFDGPPPKTRPSERLEPWPCPSEKREALAGAAHERLLPFATAAILVVERSLLDMEFRRRGLSSLLPALDERARSTPVALALAEPQRAYIRALSTSRNASVADETPTLLALPMRLSDRVAAASLDACLRPELLDSALAWERAAVASGQSMSEWAAFAALDLRASPTG